MAKICIWGRLADWLYHSATNLPRHALWSNNGRCHHWMAGNLPCAPCHHPEHHPGPWKVIPVETWHARKNWVRQWNSVSYWPHRGLGQRTRYWVGVLHPLPCTSLWKDWTVQCTAINHSGSNGVGIF